MEQLAKGALTNDMIVRISHTSGDSPTFSQLMREVREEENWIKAWEGEKTAARVTTAAVSRAPIVPEIDRLREEVRELSNQVSRLLNAAPVTAVPECAKAKAGPVNHMSDVMAHEVLSRGKPTQSFPPIIFCYTCGEDGHTKQECKGSEDLRKVNEKLIKKAVKERHGALTETRSTTCSSNVGSNVTQLPKGLVSPSSVVPVQIEGVYARALLDSGSKVTILYCSFYDAYLKHLPLMPVQNLEIWGLNSHQYPYDGYLPI